MNDTVKNRITSPSESKGWGPMIAVKPEEADGRVSVTYSIPFEEKYILKRRGKHEITIYN